MRFGRLVFAVSLSLISLSATADELKIKVVDPDELAVDRVHGQDRDQQHQGGWSDLWTHGVVGHKGAGGRTIDNSMHDE